MATFPIVCESCGAKYRLPDTFTAAKVKCKQCQHAIDVAAQRASDDPEPAPAPAPSRPAGAASRRPAAASYDEEIGYRVDVRQLKREQQAKVMKIAWAIAGTMCLIGVIFAYVAVSSRKQREAEELAAKEHRQDIVARLQKNPLNNLDSILADLKFIDEERANWVTWNDVNSTINSLKGKLNLKADELRLSQGTVDSLNEVQKKLDGNPPVEVLENLFKDVRGDLKDKCSQLSDELKSRLGELTKRTDEAYVSALATKAAADATNAKEGAQLLSYGAYEDVLRQLAEEATAAKDPAAATYGQKALEAQKTINTIVEQLFDQGYQDRVQWRDLLVDPSAWEGTPSETMKFQFNGSGLAISNEAGEAVKTAGIFFKPGRNWRDYVCDVELKLDSGTMTFYTRVGGVMDTKKVPGLSLGKEKVDVPIEYGQTIQAVFSVIGGQFKVSINGTETKNDAIGKSLSRKGPVGIAVKAGTTLTISKLKVRHLR